MGAGAGINTERAVISCFCTRGRKFFIPEKVEKASDKTYGRTGNSFLRVFKSSLQGDKLVTPQVYESALNSEIYHVGPVVVDKEGNNFYVTRTYSGKLGEKNKQVKLKSYTKKSGVT